MQRLRPWMRVPLALLIATAIWLPLLHFFHAPDAEGVARGLTSKQLALWSDETTRQAEIAKMRRTNPEWDLMARSFLVYGLANAALRDPAIEARALEAIDRIIDDTLERERTGGLHHFLMSYSRAAPFLVEPQSSQFTDGELALMLAMRRMVKEKDAYRAPLAERTQRMTSRMQKSPVFSGESYPDECWTFCNTIALAALKLTDKLDGSDHRELTRAWLEAAKARLIDTKTGLLVSSYALDGTHKDGPEGSSIWLSAHMLAVVDEPFAADQYARAKRELGGSVLGFGYAREWPSSWRGGKDVDSGPLIPLLDISPGSSGLALVGARAFGDHAYTTQLVATLDLAAFPVKDDRGLRFAASNAVGDAVMLYALTLGPIWERARDRGRAK